MKYLKTYEQVNKINLDNLKPGDYIYCVEEPGSYTSNKKVLDFIRNNIGIFVEYLPESNKSRESYLVKYENIPDDIKDKFFYVDSNNNEYGDCYVFFGYEIIDYSENKEDLQYILDTNKYNL